MKIQSETEVSDYIKADRLDSEPKRFLTEFGCVLLFAVWLFLNKDMMPQGKEFILIPAFLFIFIDLRFFFF